MSTKLERLIAIDSQIRAGRYPNARTISARFEVSERTIYDDLTFLRERLNAPVEYDPARGGWHYTEANWVLPAFITTEGELLAFLLSTQLAGSYLGSEYETVLRKAIAELAQSLPDEVQLNLGELAALYSFVAGATTATNPRLLSDLATALRERWPVEVVYYTASRDTRSKRVLHPFALRNVQGDWNLVAHDSLRGTVRVFALPRIEQWQLVRGQHFAWPEDFSLEDYMESAFLSERGDTSEQITIRFDAYQARYIRERQWHATQEPLEELPDGGVILRFRSGALDEIKRWVLKYGPHAEALGPPALRAAIATDLAATMKKYGGEHLTEDISQ